MNDEVKIIPMLVAVRRGMMVSLNGGGRAEIVGTFEGKVLGRIGELYWNGTAWVDPPPAELVEIHGVSLED